MSSSILQIISSIPDEWNGTTFKNHQLLGRSGFVSRLDDLINTKNKLGENISSNDLENIGNAEDYLRVATNISTTLEYFLAKEKNLSIDQVYTFGSKTMPIVAVVLCSNKPVDLYIDNKEAPFNDNELNIIKLLGGDLKIHKTKPEKSSNNDNIILVLESIMDSSYNFIDGMIGDNILYILNLNNIKSSDILVIRKRMATPLTSPMAIDKLMNIAGNDSYYSQFNEFSSNDLEELYDHLQTLCGTDINKNAKPVICTAGLSTIASLWVTLLSHGGADIVMASTAYGGSSQLADIVTNATYKLNKHTFDIQGISSNLVERIEVTLNKLLEEKEKLLPLTVVFVEIPTNPDMKVPEVSKIAKLIQSYKEKSSKDVLILVDTTFAPGSQVLKKFKDLVSDLSVMCFISLSKSVSRGITTAGCLVANHTEFTTKLVNDVQKTSKMFDTGAKNDQLQRLIQNHKGVEQRCEKAYKVAVDVGSYLQEQVKLNCNSYNMPLAFPTVNQALQGFTSSTFSFNLPPLKNGTNEDNEKLAQYFVDLLCKHPEFKPCVSFGQDNGLVYATVPATSTQGAIKEEDKAKQAVGGVQLVRLSFSPTVDVKAVNKIVQEAIETIYKN